MSFTGAAATSSVQPLEIVGQGGQISGEHQSSHHDILEEEVLDEVLLLLARLDRERLRLINGCEREREIREKLRDNIDQWRLRRLRDLPLAVQKGSFCWNEALRRFSSSRRTRRVHHRHHRIAVAHRLQRASLGENVGQNRFGAHVASPIGDRGERHSSDDSVDHGESANGIGRNQTDRRSVERNRTGIDDESSEERRHVGQIDARESTRRNRTRRDPRRNRQSGEICAENHVGRRGETRRTTRFDFRSKLEAAVDQHKTYEKTIREAKETVKKNDRAYNSEVKKRDANRAEGTTLKLKVKFSSHPPPFALTLKISVVDVAKRSRTNSKRN